MCALYAITAEERRAEISYDLWRSRIHPDDLALADPAHGDPGRIGDQAITAYRIVLPGGEVRHIQANAQVEFGPDGSPRCVIGVNRDITDQVHYEQLLQETNAELEEHVAARTADLQAALAELQRAGRLKDEFLAMISHELRTPLTGVLSMSELLEDQIAGPLNARQAFYVKGIAVEVDPPALAVTADATALADVLKRLLDNAVKFTPIGGQIGLEAHRGAAPDTVNLVVWDSGIGIPPDQLDHILKPFTQADARLARAPTKASASASPMSTRWCT